MSPLLAAATAFVVVLLSLALPARAMVPSGSPISPGGTAVVWGSDATGGEGFGLALRSDGRALSWGDDGPEHLATIPAPPAGRRDGLIAGSKDIGAGILQTVRSVSARSAPSARPVVSVNATATAATPTGSATLADGGRVLAQAQLVGGAATLLMSAAPTVTRLKVPKHAKAGHRVQARVIVTPAATGKVAVDDGRGKRRSGTLKAGVAAARLARLPRGRQRLEAVYADSPAYLSSSSATVKREVR